MATIEISDDLAAEVEKLAKSRGQSLQTFVYGLLVEAVEDEDSYSKTIERSELHKKSGSKGRPLNELMKELG